MFTLDDRLKGLPAAREQVLALYASLNQPHVAVPGRRAGNAQAYVVGLRGPGGAGAVFVYLHLAASGECAVYVSGRRAVPVDRLPEEQSAAIAFVESMGFMMDPVSFGALPRAQQEELLRRLPVFQKDPRSAHGKLPSLSTLGKLLGSL